MWIFTLLKYHYYFPIRTSVALEDDDQMANVIQSRLHWSERGFIQSHRSTDTGGS